jgi:hypothetical protein
MFQPNYQALPQQEEAPVLESQPAYFKPYLYNSQNAVFVPVELATFTPQPDNATPLLQTHSQLPPIEKPGLVEKVLSYAPPSMQDKVKLAYKNYGEPVKRHIYKHKRTITKVAGCIAGFIICAAFVLLILGVVGWAVVYTCLNPKFTNHQNFSTDAQFKQLIINAKTVSK